MLSLETCVCVCVCVLFILKILKTHLCVIYSAAIFFFHENYSHKLGCSLYLSLVKFLMPRTEAGLD